MGKFPCKYMIVYMHALCIHIHVPRLLAALSYTYIASLLLLVLLTCTHRFPPQVSWVLETLPSSLRMQMKTIAISIEFFGPRYDMVNAHFDNCIMLYIYLYFYLSLSIMPHHANFENILGILQKSWLNNRTMQHYCCQMSECLMPAAGIIYKIPLPELVRLTEGESR